MTGKAKGGFLTLREIQIVKMKLGKGLTHAQIARETGTSKANVSKTLGRIARKVKGIDDSLKLLQEVGLISKPAHFTLTAKGRQLAKLRSPRSTDSGMGQ